MRNITIKIAGVLCVIAGSMNIGIKLQKGSNDILSLSYMACLVLLGLYFLIIFKPKEKK